MTKTSDDTPHSLGRRTAEILRIRELSALSVSNAIGVHHTTLARFMDGESHLGAGALRRLAEHLGVSLDYLLGITDDITPGDRHAAGEAERVAAGGCARDRAGDDAGLEPTRTQEAQAVAARP